jgi:enamine deaminase RidA (YjgF/YER057c/UK114 family)
LQTSICGAIQRDLLGYFYMTVQRLHITERFSEIAVAGNLVHLAGQLASDFSLDIRGQTQQTLAIIDQFLADAGTDKSKIMSVTIYLKNIEQDYAAFNEIWDAWVADIQALPRTCVEAKLYDPRVLVEMTVVAIKA